MPQSDATSTTAVADGDTAPGVPLLARRESSSQHSESSQTAAEFIREQMQLEADAREALPYSIQDCTHHLGPLRQSVFSCLTCNPPPADSESPYNAAGVCYSCSIQCHGEHELVEIFTKRNFTCDCGTTRLPADRPCTLRVDPATNTKGVHSEAPDTNNKYNHNFRNRFCGCECDYDPFQQKGTMFQCLGLGTHESGGCGEDWWHPGCVVGLGPKWFEDVQCVKTAVPAPPAAPAAAPRPPLPTIAEDAEAAESEARPGPDPVDQDGEVEEDDLPMPPGFPEEDSFESFLCYKCVDAYPWIKRYAGAEGFHQAVFSRPQAQTNEDQPEETTSQKRKAEVESDAGSQETKRHKTEAAQEQTQQQSTADGSDVKAAGKTEAVAAAPSNPEAKPPAACKLGALPPAPIGQFSLFLKESFRDNLCRCPACFPLLKPHPQLLEEEETYEPPVSEDGASEHGSTQGSLLELGESALRGVDRVRAIEGVMAYNHLKDKLKGFLQPFAQSGEAVSAEDIKQIFAKLRGDDEAIRNAAETASKSTDHRREQSGY